MLERLQHRRLAPWLAAALLSCSPGPLDFTGKRCNEERHCPSGWYCSTEQTCRPEGSRNRLVNGDFEDGVTGWVANPLPEALVSSQPGRSSGSAAGWNISGGAGSMVRPQTAAIDNPAEGTWCAQAWVRGSDGAAVELEILEDGEAADYGIALAADDVWTRIEARNLVVFPSPLSVALRSPADAGVRQLYLDDVALWQPIQDGPCAAPP
ncbi:MAG: hypothetical protein ACYC8T_35085 [Myxococcaceae bacterium]